MAPEHEREAETESVDVKSVRQLNQSFYDAFEADDFERLASIWEHSDRVQCTHPGWSVLRGWSEVGASWQAMIEGPGQLQFVLTNEYVEVQGAVAWVSVDENIIAENTSSTVVALNMFSRDSAGRWRMIGHHGSAIMMPGLPH